MIQHVQIYTHFKKVQQKELLNKKKKHSKQKKNKSTDHGKVKDKATRLRRDRSLTVKRENSSAVWFWERSVESWKEAVETLLRTVEPLLVQAESENMTTAWLSQCWCLQTPKLRHKNTAQCVSPPLDWSAFRWSSSCWTGDPGHRAAAVDTC